MSRKRKPVLQLGAASSKLHKYGYSKEFHAADKKGKSSLPALVGNYSDSEGDDSQNEEEEHAGDVSVSQAAMPEYTETSAHQHLNPGNGDIARPEHCKSPDMDDELKNFLSEIEAIPMPTDGGGDQDQKSNDAEQGNARSFASTEATREVTPDNVDGLSIETSDQAVGSTSNKSKPQYSMFVKGASEFVHSPSSQEGEKIGTKGEETEKGPEEDIPEEPTSCWQLVQDEGSQYYYYWNTITNEVTWEIPSEYTQFLLLHREFTEKLARLPPNVLKTYQERKTKEAEAFNAAATQSSAAASSDAHTQHLAYGPDSVASSTSSSVTAEQTSSSHHVQKKHRKEKKKRRHKRRHSDSSSDSSDEEDSKELSKTQVIGPQLPQGKQTSSVSVTNFTDISSTPKSTTGSPFLSIVPYLSDADEDETGENEDEDKITTAPGKKTVSKNKLHLSSSEAQESGENNSEAGDDHGMGDISNLHEKVKDITGEQSEKTKEEDKDSELSLSLGCGNISATGSKTMSKVENPPKEIIDMFAEDVPQSLSFVENTEASKANNKTEKETEEGRGKQYPTSQNSSKNSFSSKLSSLGPKITTEEKKPKSKGKKSATNLLNIVGYGSDDEEQTTTDDKEVNEQRTEVIKEEEILSSTKQSISPSETKKRKKEKKKHRHGEKDKREDEERRGVSPPNILTGNLGKDIKARVEETLDKEISDIVIHTVSQPSLSVQADNISDKLSHQSKELQAEERKLSKHSQPEKEVEKSLRTKEDSKNAEKIKIQKHLTLELPVKSEEEKEKMTYDQTIESDLVQLKKGINGDKVCNNDEDDDDDIDFEDLDDLDRALEVALEKKKVELAKYEEQERKQQECSAQEQSLEENSVVEKPLISGVKAEPSWESEEKLKAEVKDVAELSLNKLEFLDISTDNLSRLQILFIELQTRLHDWTAGGLSTSYFQEQLGVAQGLLEQYEQSAVPQGWACQWDRGNNRYYYRNLSTNRIQWDYPDPDPGKSQAENTSSSGVGNETKTGDGSGKTRKEEADKKSSTSKRGRSHERGSTGGVGSGEDKDGLRKKGSSSSSKHRKREERDKDRGSKHDKRSKDGSSSSHRYRRKRRRRRDHSSSSDSSDDDGGDSTNIPASKSNSVTSSSSSRRHHRHHHKASKKKKKRRSEQRSRSPSVEIVAASDDKEGSGKEDEDNDKSTPSVTVLEVSPNNSSAASSPRRDGETQATAKTFPQPSAPTSLSESIDGEPLVKNDSAGKVAGDEGHDLDGVSLDLEERKSREEGEINEEEGDEEEEEEKKGDDASNPAVIYKPPQLLVPPQVVAAARQPEFYGAPQPASTMQAPATSSVQAPPSVSSGYVPNQVESSQAPSDGRGLPETAEEAEKQARKKKKDKKLATGPSLMMKKKHMSSMVQKWQKVKKEVEKEDRAKEMRQAAIRKKIEELK